MRFLFFFVRRLIASQRGTSGISLFSGIAISGIALGVATLIVALNILAGYRSLFSERLANLDSHIQTVGYGILRLPQMNASMAKIRNVLDSTCTDVQPFIDRLVLLSSGNRKEGITLKGVLPDYFKKKTLITCTSGSLKLNDDSSIVIGKTLAQKLFVKQGGIIIAFALKNTLSLTPENLPAVQRYRVTGIFQSGLDKYDNAYCYVSKSSADMLFDFLPDQVSGYEIKLTSIDSIPGAVAKLKDALGPSYYYSTIYQMYAPVFTWIKLQEQPIPIILGLIVLVAVFNIVSVSLMLALERAEHIGVLRTLGAKRSLITRAFILQGMYLGLAGILSGNIIAWIISYLQMEYQIVKLPATVYFTSAAPMAMPAESFVIVSVCGVLLTFIIALIPSFAASRLSPVETLKFQ